MSEPSSSSLHKIRLVWAGAFVSGLVVTDLALKLFCDSWPLLIYLAFGGIGAGLGPRLQRRFSGETLGSTIIRRGTRGLSLLSLAGLVVLFAMPVSWDTKCSWRYCGRALGAGLFKSPFSVGTPTCSGWNKCVNEYPYSEGEYRKALKHIRQQDCAAP